MPEGENLPNMIVLFLDKVEAVKYGSSNIAKYGQIFQIREMVIVYLDKVKTVKGGRQALLREGIRPGNVFFNLLLKFMLSSVET